MLDFGGFEVRNHLVLTPANSVIFFKSLPAINQQQKKMVVTDQQTLLHQLHHKLSAKKTGMIPYRDM